MRECLQMRIRPSLIIIIYSSLPDIPSAFDEAAHHIAHTKKDPEISKLDSEEKARDKTALERPPVASPRRRAVDNMMVVWDVWYSQ